jgi:hypothetical protein
VAETVAVAAAAAAAAVVADGVAVAAAVVVVGVAVGVGVGVGVAGTVNAPQKGDVVVKVIVPHRLLDVEKVLSGISHVSSDGAQYEPVVPVVVDGELVVHEHTLPVVVQSWKPEVHHPQPVVASQVVEVVLEVHVANCPDSVDVHAAADASGTQVAARNAAAERARVARIFFFFFFFFFL